MDFKGIPSLQGLDRAVGTFLLLGPQGRWSAGRACLCGSGADDARGRRARRSGRAARSVRHSGADLPVATLQR